MKLTIALVVCAAALPALAVEPLLLESFSYPNGALTNVAGGIWNTYSGLGGALTLKVSDGRAFINQADTTSGGDDCSRLINASFDPATDNSSKLYAGFSVNFSAAPFSGGSFFAHFKSSGSSSEFYSRIGADQEGAAPGTFRLAIDNEHWDAATTTEFPLDLKLNTEYTVVVRLDLATDQSTLWVNPVDESSPSVTATDLITYGTGLSIDSFALRQGTTGTGFPGSLYLDNLRVGTSFETAIPEPQGLLAFGALFLLGWRRLRGNS